MSTNHNWSGTFRFVKFVDEEPEVDLSKPGDRSALLDITELEYVKSKSNFFWGSWDSKKREIDDLKKELSSQKKQFGKTKEIKTANNQETLP